MHSYFVGIAEQNLLSKNHEFIGFGSVVSSLRRRDFAAFWFDIGSIPSVGILSFNCTVPSVFPEVEFWADEYIFVTDAIVLLLFEKEEQFELYV